MGVLIDIPGIAGGERASGKLAVKAISEFTYTKGTAKRVTLANRTGNIEHVVWGTATPRDTDGNEIVVGDVYYAEFSTGSYRGVTNIDRLHSMERLSPDDYDLSDFAPSARQGTDAMREAVNAAIVDMKDESVLRLSQAMLNEVRKSYFEAPAAIKMHSAYIGGLAEHALNLVAAAQALFPIYKPFFPDLNEDHVIFGCLFHDLGKCVEYAVKTAAIEPTLEGELVNHIVYGPALIERLYQEADVSRETALRLQHILASHHGQLDFGSPVPPKTVEALFMHLLDMMDSKMMHAHKMIADAPGDGDFTGYSIDTKARFLKTALGNLPV